MHTQFVPGHVHLKDLGDLVAGAIREAGGVPRDRDRPVSTALRAYAALATSAHTGAVRRVP